MYKSEVLNDFETYRIKYGIFDDLQHIESYYNGKGRFYHNMEHLDEVLCEVEKFKDLHTDEEYQILVMTAIYHDIIYDPKAKDNEEKSAEMVKVCSGEEHILKQVQELILFTKYQRNPETELEDTFMCCDMAIFEKPFEQQLVFEKKIQKEFAWVPLSVYVPERINVLDKIRQLYFGHPDNYCINTTKLITYLENKKWNIGVYAGSFYPFTAGHYDILKQAENIFDKVIILQSNNGKSKGELLWNTDILGELNSVLNNYEVHNISKLITDDLKSFSHLGNVTLIRGLRNGSDLLYEQNYIQTLRDIDPNINVSYFLTKPEYAHVSSSMVRELLKIDPVLAKKYLQY
ncbi:MAG: hypothetical protein E6R13_00725 [Spirochaetes bacterium]|nr:MAG: hypothetical protein E6R13_00725 [Spirochaetota bacterium]